MFVSSYGGERCGLWVAKVLILIRVTVREYSESPKHVLLQYNEVTCPMYMVDVTLGSVF